MKSVSNKMSYFAIMVIMGAIIISFVLTGFQGFGNSAGQIGSVDGNPITSREFNQAVQEQMNRYTQMFKVKSLTNQQIRQFKVKEAALQTLVSRKLISNFANDLKFDAGKKSIKEEIKKYKVFQTGDKLDVTKYKALLKANRLSPTKWEAGVISDIKTKKLSSLLGTIQDSEGAARNLLRLRKVEMKSLVASFDKEKMTEFVPVPSKEVNKFVNDKKNDGLLRGLYRTYEVVQQQTKKKANKFDLVKKTLAKKHLQKTKRLELTALIKDIKKQISDAMAGKRISTLKKLQKKYKLDFDQKYIFTPFNTKYKTTSFKEGEVLDMIKNKDTKKVIEADSATSITIARAISFKNEEVKEKELKKELAFSGQRNARFLEQAILKYKEKTSKVTTAANLFN